ncbi:MAG: prepilin-type N-terminal cleavage/methylation domain-containing protein [Patescibacteria group bacterium]
MTINRQAGLTIIELLLVIAIISIIGLMSTSFYSRFLTQNTVENTENQLVSSFRKAQVYSMMGKQNGVWGVRYTLSPKKITLYLSGNPAFDEIYNVNNNITISDFTDISFAKITGLPNSSGVPITSPVTITITGGNNNKTITINSQGVVSKTN